MAARFSPFASDLEGGGGGGMSESLPGCEVRIAAGAVGISPVRRARGPVGIGFPASPLIPSLRDEFDDGAPFL